MRSCNFLGAAQTGCTGTAAALRATADFLYDIGRIASVAPANRDGVGALYVNTTTAQFLEDGLIAVGVDVLGADDDLNLASIPTSADSTCSGTVDLTTARNVVRRCPDLVLGQPRLRVAHRVQRRRRAKLRRVPGLGGDFVEVCDPSNDLVREAPRLRPHLAAAAHERRHDR